MRKSISLIALLVAGGCLWSMAAPVSKSRAAEIATKYVENYTGGTKLTVRSTEVMNDGLYLVNFAPTGFAIVSSDDNAEPIIGYSTDSNLSPYKMPDNIAYMMGEADRYVKYNAANGKLNTQWSRIAQGKTVQSRAAEPVDPPLITVNWDQGDPWNKFCPGEGAKKAYVGCVAVAMSQAMSVQRYPERPYGQSSYACPGYGRLSIDFEKEAPYDWNTILTKPLSESVSHLLYHAGMSVFMEYGTDGSGIPSNQVYRITDALKNNFNYPDVSYQWRSSYRGDWTQALLNELYAGHAIVYNAIDSKGGYGHSFNLDGYRDGKFHVNWGWGGTGNGWFSIDNLGDSFMGMHYDSNHVAVFGIGAGNSPLKKISLTDNLIEEDTPAGTAVMALMVNGEKSTKDYVVKVTGEWDAASSSYKDVPFKYQDGILITTRELSQSEGPIFVRVEVKVKGNDTYKMIQAFNIDVVAPQPLESRVSMNYDRNTKTFKIQSKFGSEYTIKNASGAIVLQGSLTDSNAFEFQRSQLSAGTNTVEIVAGAKSKVFKIKI